MEALSFLETTTEVAITFAGFISIFLVLARRDGSFEPSVAVVIRLLLLASILGLALAAFPIVLSLLAVGDPTLWRVSSAVMLLVGVGVSIYVFRKRKVIAPNVLVPIAVLFTFAQLGVSLFNTVGWPLEPSGGMYVLGVWLILGIGAMNFIDLVFNRVLEDPADQ